MYASCHGRLFFLFFFFFISLKKIIFVYSILTLGPLYAEHQTKSLHRSAAPGNNGTPTSPYDGPLKSTYSAHRHLLPRRPYLRVYLLVSLSHPSSSALTPHFLSSPLRDSLLTQFSDYGVGHRRKFTCQMIFPRGVRRDNQDRAEPLPNGLGSPGSHEGRQRAPSGGRGRESQ